MSWGHVYWDNNARLCLLIIVVAVPNTLQGSAAAEVLICLLSGLWLFYGMRANTLDKLCWVLHVTHHSSCALTPCKELTDEEIYLYVKQSI